jgi:hypothetical protein
VYRLTEGKREIRWTVSMVPRTRRWRTQSTRNRIGRPNRMRGLSVRRQVTRVDLLVQYAAEIAQSLGEQNVTEGE